MPKILKFPKNFFWGASISSHQVEGGNKNNWTEWEMKNAGIQVEKASQRYEEWQRSEFPEMFEKANYISGKAADHYNLYKEDIKILKKLNLNSFRFSLEWSRIEPEEGKFDKEAIKHYRRVLEELKKNDIEPFVTLWHWTSPLWLTGKGGESSKHFIFYFERFVQKITGEYKDLVKYWMTINEPTLIMFESYLAGNRPPQKRNPFTAYQV